MLNLITTTSMRQVRRVYTPITPMSASMQPIVWQMSCSTPTNLAWNSQYRREIIFHPNHKSAEFNSEVSEWHSNLYPRFITWILVTVHNMTFWNSSPYCVRVPFLLKVTKGNPCLSCNADTACSCDMVTYRLAVVVR